MEFYRIALFLIFVALLHGCKITQIVPEGGRIESRTGQNNCDEGQTCVIDVENGTVFSDTFTPVPRDGYHFAGWKRAKWHLCGGKRADCPLENISADFTSLDLEMFLVPEFAAGVAPLRASDVSFKRHMEIAEQVSILVPSHLRYSRDESGPFLSTFTEQLESDDDDFQEFFALAKSESPGLPLESASLVLSSETPRTIAGFDGSDALYELQLADFPGKRFLARHLYFEFNGYFYGLIYVAEQRTYGRNAGFIDLMADSMTVGQTVMTDFVLERDLIDPGRPAVASDGSDFLVVSCKRPERYGPTSIVGRFIRRDRSMGNELELVPVSDNNYLGCWSTSPQLVFAGGSYLLVYVTNPNGNWQLVGQRIGTDGVPLDQEPILISRISQLGVQAPSVAFDGNRSLVVWYESGNQVYRIRGAFIQPDGLISAPFTIADDIKNLYELGNQEIGKVTPRVASSARGFLVVWGRSSGAEVTNTATATPLYGQLLDPDGNPMSSEPILIRGDQGVNPRYVEVSSDGENYLVAWIEGEHARYPRRHGTSEVVARRVSAAGSFLAPTEVDPAVIASNEQPFVPWGEFPTKQFLDLAFDGEDFTLIWAAYGYDRGAYASRASRVLSSVSEPFPVAGVPDDVGYESVNEPREPAVAFSNQMGLVAWVSNPLEAWLFDRASGVTQLNPERLLNQNQQRPPRAGSASLSPAEVPAWFAATEQFSKLGATLYRALDAYRRSGVPVDTPVAACSRSGNIVLEAPLENGRDRLRFDNCGIEYNLVLEGVLTIESQGPGLIYSGTIEASAVDLKLSRLDTWHHYSGSVRLETSSLNLSDPRLRLQMDVRNHRGSSYRLDKVEFSVIPGNDPDWLDLYGYAGQIAHQGGSLTLQSGEADAPIQLLAAENARATFEVGYGYSDILYRRPPGTTNGGVRVLNEKVNSGEVDFFSAANSPPQAVSTEKLDRYNVDRGFSDIRVASQEGRAYEFDVLGLVTDPDGDTLRYEVDVTGVEAVDDNGYPNSKQAPGRDFTLVQLSPSTFRLTAEEPGQYQLRVIGRDSAGGESDPQNVTLTFLPDTDRDGFLDRHDYDDDNDGVEDSDDAFPKDPLETLDSDEDGTGDNADPDDDNDGTQDGEDLFPLNPSCSRAEDANENGCYADQVGDWTLYYNGGRYMYFFRVGVNDIARWDVAQQRFVKPVNLGSHVAADDIARSAGLVEKHNRLYIGYGSGIITYVDLDSLGEETFFADASSSIMRLVDGVNFLLAFRWNGSPGREKVRVYKSSGAVAAQHSLSPGSGSPSFGYDAAQDVFYGHFEGGDFDIATGQIVPEQEKLDAPPAASSPDGRYSLRTNGEIVDMQSRKVIGVVPSFSYRDEGNGIVIWNQFGLSYLGAGSYNRVNVYGELIESVSHGGHYSHKIYDAGGSIFLVSGGSYYGAPLSITTFSPSNDTDGDGIENLSDQFPNDPAASRDDDYDGYPDAWNAGYSEADTTLTLDPYPGAPDCNVEWQSDPNYCDIASTIRSAYFHTVGDDGIVYMIGRDSLVHRYSLEEQRYLPSIPAGSTNPYDPSWAGPADIAYSSVDNRLYLAFGGERRRLSYVDLADPTRAHRLNWLQEDPNRLIATDDYLVISTRENQTVRYFYDRAGNLVQTSDYPDYPDGMIWDKARNRLYTTRSYTGIYVESLEPGQFTGEATLFLDTQTGTGRNPIAISPDGLSLISRSHIIYNTLDGSVRGALPEPAGGINQYHWLSDGKIVRFDSSTLEVYGADFKLRGSLSAEDLPGTPSGLLEYKGAVFLIVASGYSGPSGFFEITLP